MTSGEEPAKDSRMSTSRSVVTGPNRDSLPRQLCARFQECKGQIDENGVEKLRSGNLVNQLETILELDTAFVAIRFEGCNDTFTSSSIRCHNCDKFRSTVG